MGEDNGASGGVCWGATGSSVNRECGMHQDAGKVYRIVVRSELSERYAAAFEGMEMEANDGLTVLTGNIVDQPHLYGILDRLSGLGLELLDVQCLSEGTEDDVATSPPWTRPGN
jgi:hypothetical protein